MLASSGMQGDALTLHKNLMARIVWYKHQNGKDMSTTAIAQLLSNTLYYKRFFPYYTFNVLGGIDDNGISRKYIYIFKRNFKLKIYIFFQNTGVGCAYSYDAVGSFERVKYSSSGTGQQLIQPFLDNQVN